MRGENSPEPVLEQKEEESTRDKLSEFLNQALAHNTFSATSSIDHTKSNIVPEPLNQTISFSKQNSVIFGLNRKVYENYTSEHFKKSKLSQF